MFADAGYVPTTYYWSRENKYGSQAVGFRCRTWWHALRSRYTTGWSAWLRVNHLPIPSEGSSLRTSCIRSYFLVCSQGYMWTVNFPSLVTTWLPFLIYRLLSWAGHTGLFPVHKFNFSFFFVLFLSWLRVAQYMIELRCVVAVYSILYIGRTWTL